MFKLQRIPLQIELLLAELQIFFNDYQWLHFRALLLSLLLTPYKATINGMVKILSYGSHRRKHNEFINDCNQILTKVLRYYAMMILSYLKKPGEPIYFIIDDTTNKRRGKHIVAAFKYFDHISKQYIWGHQLVCAIIEYRGIVIPYGIDIYVPQEEQKAVDVPFRKKTEMALDLLKVFEPEEGQEVFVLADTFYAAPSILNLCRQRRYSFVSMLKTNRILYIDGRRMNVDTYLRGVFKPNKRKRTIRLKRNKYEVHSNQAVLKSGGAVKLVCTRNTSHRTAKVIFTTNAALPIESILTAYQQRWSIEVFFKMSKQYLGLRANQNRNLAANDSAVKLSLIAHNLLTHVFLEEMRAQGKRLTEKNLALFSVLTVRDRIRHIAQVDSIEYCLERNSNKSKNKVITEIKKMLLAA